MRACRYRLAGQLIEANPRFVRVVTVAAMAALASAASTLEVRAQPAAPRGEINGQVRDANTELPLARADVSIQVGEVTRSASTDAQGHFHLSDVPAGAYLLLVVRSGYAPVAQPDVIVTSGRQTPVVVSLPPVPSYEESVRVEASAFARPPDAPTGANTLSAEEIRRAPGGLGDVSRLTQALPGVATSSDQRNDIIARGGSPSENLTVVDGIEVANLNHFAAQGTSGGPISMLNTELIQSATFLAGGFPAAYGDRLSSVLDVSLREGNRDKVETDIDLGFAGVGLLAEGPFTSRGSFLVSARRSYLELLAPAFGLTAIPRYTNVQGKAVVDLTARQRLSFISLGGTDRIVFDVDANDLDDPSLLNITSSGWRATHGVVWRSLLGDRGIGTLSVSHGTATFRQRVNDAQIGNQIVLDQDSRETTLTGQYDLTYRSALVGTMKAGVSIRRLGARLGVSQPIGVDNPYSTDPTRVDAANVRTNLATSQTSAYVQTTRMVTRWVDVIGGARFDRFAFVNRSTVSPRVGVVAHVRPTFDVKASWGRFTQLPALVFLNADPVNRQLRPMRAEHRVVGVEWRPTVGLRVTVEGYQKRYEDYPVSVEYRSLSLANSGDFYGVSGLLFPMTSTGYGTARGIEFFVQQKLTDTLYGQIAYSVSRTRHAALDGVLRRGSFDVPHVLSVIGGRKFDHRFEVSTKFSVASGRPITPFEPVASLAQNRGILDLSRINGLRGPVYQRWDVRMDRRYRLPWATLLTWMEVDNILGRDNVYQYVWNPKTAQTDHVSQIGRFVVGGFTFEF